MSEQTYMDTHIWTAHTSIHTHMHACLPACFCQDSLITTYRDHCHNLTRGGSVYDTMAELFGRATGTTKGKVIKGKLKEIGPLRLLTREV